MQIEFTSKRGTMENIGLILVILIFVRMYFLIKDERHDEAAEFTTIATIVLIIYFLVKVML
jgi:hypothetical protein